MWGYSYNLILNAVKCLALNVVKKPLKFENPTIVNPKFSKYLNHKKYCKKDRTIAVNALRVVNKNSVS